MRRLMLEMLLQVCILAGTVYFGIFFICTLGWFALGLPLNQYSFWALALISLGLIYGYYLWLDSTFSNRKE